MSTEIKHFNDYENYVGVARSEYAPVLLTPHDVKHPIIMDMDYAPASLDRIVRAGDEAMTNALEWWTESAELAAYLHDRVLDSLIEAQVARIYRNDITRHLKEMKKQTAEELTDDFDVPDPVEADEIPIDIKSVLDMDDPLVVKVIKGLGSPGDILSVLKKYPDMPTSELAKLTHPLNFGASKDMNDAVDYAIENHDGIMLDESPYYKVKSFDPEMLTMTVVRKQAIAEIESDYGIIWVIRRESLIIRGDEEARGDDYLLPRKMLNSDRHHELWEKAEGYLSYIDKEKNQRYVDLDPQVKWIQSLTTSAYGKYIMNFWPRPDGR